MPCDRFSMVGAFRQAQARCEQAGNDIIDFNVEQPRVNGEL
jgi:hypothetical protein